MRDALLSRVVVSRFSFRLFFSLSKGGGLFSRLHSLTIGFARHFIADVGVALGRGTRFFL